MAKERVTEGTVKELVRLVGSLIKEEAPEELRPYVQITNGSSRAKFKMRASLDGSVFFVAETVGSSFRVAAGGPEVPFSSVQVGPYVLSILRERYPRLAADWNLNAPLRNTPGVRARQYEGYIRLEFDALTPEAYQRMVKVLVPLMHVARYDREDPL